MFDVEERYLGMLTPCFTVDLSLSLGDFNKVIKRACLTLRRISGESFFDPRTSLVFSLIEVRELLFGIVPFLESSDDNGDNDDKCIDCSKDESFAAD